MLRPFLSVQDVVNTLRPREPVHCIQPAIISRTAKSFAESFPGDVLYAVKCNAHPLVLGALYDGGVRCYDTASIEEVRTISKRYPDAECHFMHPIKSREAIEEAYFVHHVRSWAVDHVDEWEKIRDVTAGATDMTVSVRFETVRGKARMCLSGKFGASVPEAVELLRRIHDSGNRPGLTFHVGSQCLDVDAFTTSIAMAGDTMRLSGIKLDTLDIGGGFPASYIGDEPDIETLLSQITAAIRAQAFPKECRLQCEPGRALVAGGVSVLARVEMRRKGRLYLNDGSYGSLAELKYLGNCFPVRALRPSPRPALKGALEEFDFFGPTCDAVDSMPGPFWLPSDICEGDWISIDRIGAYSNALTTHFNGFGRRSWTVLEDRKPGGYVRTSAAEDRVQCTVNNLAVASS